MVIFLKHYQFICFLFILYLIFLNFKYLLQKFINFALYIIYVKNKKKNNNQNFLKWYLLSKISSLVIKPYYNEISYKFYL